MRSVKVTRTPLDGHAQASTATLLWEACRRYVDVEAVQGAISNGADVGQAAGAATRHGIAPLLWRALRTAGAVDALGEDQQSLRSVAELHQMEALVIFPRAVSAALLPLIDGGLEPVVMKGPVLAARYPEPGLRPMGDIDVLLPRQYHERALRLLGNAGWEIYRPARRDRYDTVLVNDEIPSLALELHFGLESSYEKVTELDPVALWERRQPLDCLGTPAYGLPVAEELVTLAAHAGKPFHGFSRLVWIADLAMAVGHAEEAQQPVDWEKVSWIAETGRCLTLVGAALALAQRVGVERPEDLFPLPSRGWRAVALRRLFDVSWPLVATGSNTFHLRYALTDGKWRRARLVVGSGHGMPTRRRLLWSTTVPVEALSRWWNLRHTP